MPLLVLYYLFVFGLICIPVFARTAGKFPPGWLALAGFLIMVRWLSFAMNNIGEYANGCHKIMFKEWVNGMQGTGHEPVIPTHHQNTGFHIHMTSRDTCALLLVSMVLIISGAAKYDNENLRWIIAVGGLGLGELFYRWLLELSLPNSRFWAAVGVDSPEHPTLRRDFMSKSRFTAFLKDNLNRWIGFRRGN